MFWVRYPLMQAHALFSRAESYPVHSITTRHISLIPDGPAGGALGGLPHRFPSTKEDPASRKGVWALVASLRDGSFHKKNCGLGVRRPGIQEGVAATPRPRDCSEPLPAPGRQLRWNTAVCEGWSSSEF